MEGGHAELENNNCLYIYGNSLDVLISNDSLKKYIKKVNKLF